MTESDAIALAEAHAALWSVPWQSAENVVNNQARWFSSDEWYSLTIDIDTGRVDVSIHVKSKTVNEFKYTPTDPETFLLPLWAAFPTYTSVTAGWR